MSDAVTLRGFPAHVRPQWTVRWLGSDGGDTLLQSLQRDPYGGVELGVAAGGPVVRRPVHTPPCVITQWPFRFA
jgi:hypothetical protein